MAAYFNPLAYHPIWITDHIYGVSKKVSCDLYAKGLISHQEVLDLLGISKLDKEEEQRKAYPRFYYLSKELQICKPTSIREYNSIHNRISSIFEADSKTASPRFASICEELE